EGAAVADGFAHGGEGTIELAETVRAVCESASSAFKPLYEPDSALTAKVETIARQVYGAASVQYQPGTKTRLRKFEEWGYGHLPICFAKTQYSFSHDPSLLGAPTGFTLPVVEVRLAAGAGYVQVLCGSIMTMPGLPALPSAL